MTVLEHTGTDAPARIGWIGEPWPWVRETSPVMPTLAAPPGMPSGRDTLWAAATLAASQASRGQAILAALTFLDRFPDAERLWEAAECSPGSPSLALALQLRCSSAAQVARSARAAAMAEIR
jgi:hypothetical protein